MPSLLIRTLAVLATMPLSVLGLTAAAPPSLADPDPLECGEDFSVGAGTSEDPYLISSAEELDALNDDSDCWAGEFLFLQTANIDMGGAPWRTPIGTSSNAFSGTYNGGGFTISNLDIVLSDDYVGLFGYVTGSIRNVNLEASVRVVGEDYVGGLVGYLDGGSVSDSATSANAVGEGSVGGLVGEAGIGSVIEDSQSTGDVEGEDQVGGLVGSNSGLVSDSYATGAVLTNSGEGVGGLIGQNNGTVSGSHASGTVKHSDDEDPGDNVGGLVGLQELDARVINSYATGTVIGGNNVGGLIGSARTRSLASGVYANGVVTGGSTTDANVGGLLGYNNGTLTNCYATGNIQRGGDAGGLVGENGDSGTISNCYSTGEVSGVEEEGGLVAVNAGSVANSFWDTETSGELESDGGTGKTTAEMKALVTFTDAGWSITESCDATTIWGLCSTRNSGYPYLTFRTPEPTASDRFVQFTFWLPDGQECGSISPVQVRAGSQYRLPGADAACATMPGSRIIGWKVPAPTDYTGIGSTDMPFKPGHLVNVIGAQQFTAVIWEPVVEFRYDANVGTGGACEPGDATHTSNNGHLAHIWVPREDLTQARFPTTTPCTPPGHELQAWNTAGNGTGQSYIPGNPLPETWVSDNSNTHSLYGIWRHRAAG